MTHNLLSWSDEKIAVQNVFLKQLHEGDIWFIIEAAFWNCWKEYVGWSVERKDSERPTEINNELLMEQDIHDSAINFFGTTDESLQLKRGIVEGRDFAIVNQETFSLFKQWYQLTGPEIPRKVIEVGVKSKLVVEIHPLKITIFVDNSQKQSFLFYFGRNTCVADMKQQVISSLKLAPSQLGDWQIWTLWNRTKESQLDESSNLQLSLAEVGLDGSHELLLQKAGVIENNSAESKVLTTLNGNICVKKDGTPKGVTGLVNLGNTCFLNSAIQGLSNTSELRHYFLSGTYRTDINTTNPIGTKGEMAESFSGLVRDLWAGDIQYIAPKEFKRRLGKHAPQFAGYDQHDSQEVLSYMLDAIHEDLNRVKDKPFIPVEDVSSHEMEYQDSKRFWENHLKRNDSVVVDLFQAQFKSTICCPDCNKISVTFDPLMYLSLPLPLNSLSKFQITYVSSSSVLRFWIQSKATDSIQILKQQMATFLATKGILTTVPETWIVTEIMNSRFHKFLNDGSILDDIHPDHKIVIYDIPKDDLASPCSILLPCVQSVVSPAKFKDTRKLHPIHETLNYIGIPILVQTQRINSCSAIYDLVWTKIQQLTSLAIAFREEYPFVLHLMNRNGSFSRILDTDDETPPIQNGQYLIIEWDIKVDRDNHLSKSLSEAISIENPFALRKDTEIALEDCLDHFTKTEKLGESDKWYCSQCKDHKQATKKMELFSLPKMLIIHLKRFNFVNALWRDKIGVPVRYPISNWDISKKVLATNHDSSQRFVYDLYSVVNHFGNTLGGHYTNLSYNDELKHWVLYDDQKCVIVEEDAVLSENAYLLFYKRRG